MAIDFKGEHLVPGYLGQCLVILSFGSALLATISYYFATTHAHRHNYSWRKLARIGFYLNAMGIFGIGACLFYIIYHHLFEYHYAWAHSSRTLPIHYIISSYWEGQEGSFWLWAFWQSVLGVFLMARGKSWENPVMTILMLSQTCLASMLLGVDVAGYKLGSSPFILLRQAVDAPIFSRANYLDFIKDGNGLNPLLQNYWMVIHPPTLFLGFAAMIVPFAYALAGLWQKKYKEWVQPAIVYVLFAVMILGAGIIMGAFWAYESLNFGGFWAWDPVENASLIPWLTLIAGLHVLIVYKNTGHAYVTALLLVLVSFLLVLYASFLTRSGILGESSVHAFTDLGMSGQLLMYLSLFALIAVTLVIIRWKELPISEKDETTYSREFWLFVGAAFLTLSCFHLLVVTSIPVYNAIFSSKLAPPTSPASYYSTIQAIFAVMILLLTGFVQFLKYKKSNTRQFVSHALSYLLASTIITIFIVCFTGIYKMKIVFLLMVWTGVYAILSNIKILSDVLKRKVRLSGSALAHIGFGLLLIGALLSVGTKRVISINNSGYSYGTAFEKSNKSAENIRLNWQVPVKMDKYLVTYLGDSLVGPNHYFKVNYKVIDKHSGAVQENFTLYPNAQANQKMGLISSPATKHKLFHDLYTFVSMAPITSQEGIPGNETKESNQNTDDKKYQKPILYEVAVGDTLSFREGIMVLKGLNKNVKIAHVAPHKNDVLLGAMLEVITPQGNRHTVEPVLMIRDNVLFDFAKTVDPLGLKLRFTKISPDSHKMGILVYQQLETEKPYIVLQAILFPYINFFWSGAVIMVLGFLLALWRRSKELNKLVV